MTSLAPSGLAAPTLFTCSDTALFNCGSFTGNASYLASAYTRSGSTGGWFARTGSIRAVPEPGALALLGLGLAGLGMSRRRQAN